MRKYCSFENKYKNYTIWNVSEKKKKKYIYEGKIRLFIFTSTIDRPQHYRPSQQQQTATSELWLFFIIIISPCSKYRPYNLPISKIVKTRTYVFFFFFLSRKLSISNSNFGNTANFSVRNPATGPKFFFFLAGRAVIFFVSSHSIGMNIVNRRFTSVANNDTIKCGGRVRIPINLKRTQPVSI